MNKSKLKERAKSILNGFPINHVFDVDSSEHKFLNRLFEGHPEYSIKSGTGIKNLSIGVGGKFKTRCFMINRINGTSTDISYIRSVDGATSKISDIKCACRSAIDPVIIEFKKGVRYGIDTCQITGELLTKDNTHIDHYDMTFDELFGLWIKDLSIDLLHSLLNDSTIDNATSIYFKSEIIANGFVVFHNDNTNLRAVTKKANLSILTRKKHD